MNAHPNDLPKSGLVIAGLVLGIIALLSSWIPFINNLSFFLGIVGLVLAVIGLVGTLRGKKSGKALAIATVVINIVAMAFVFSSQAALSSAIDEATEGTVSTEDVSHSDDANGTDAAQEQKYTISDVNLEGDEYSAKITGTFTNNTDEEINYLGIEYRLLDASGAQIGSAYANASHVAGGSTLKFEATALVSLDEIASYELADVTGF